jgi:hypothetical protein
VSADGNRFHQFSQRARRDAMQYMGSTQLNDYLNKLAFRKEYPIVENKQLDLKTKR